MQISELLETVPLAPNILKTGSRKSAKYLGKAQWEQHAIQIVKYGTREEDSN